MKIIKHLLMVFLFSCYGCKDQHSRVEYMRNPNSFAFPHNIDSLQSYELPKEIKLNGDLLEAYSWIDNMGKNYLIIYTIGPYLDSTTDFESGDRYMEFFAKQFNDKNGTFHLLWEINDSVVDCPFPIWIGTLPNSTSITDLDSNGITETTLVYRYSCRSDVYPSGMKVIIHERDRKYVLEGLMVSPIDTSKIIIDSDFEPNLQNHIFDSAGMKWSEIILSISGKYDNDADFKDAPPEFLNFAKQKWLDFVKEDNFNYY